MVKRSATALLLLIAAPAVVAHDLIGTKVTWEREIAPIVRARCVTCHSEEGAAPMSLATYDEARPWARAIREEVLTRRMPKWHVVRGYGDFSNDPSLSAFEIALITAWVDGGAPRSLPRTTPAAADPRADPASAHTGLAGETREVTLPCRSTILPAGKVVAMKPLLGPGGSLRMTVTHPDGLQEPLLWVRDFEPEYATAYWLRTPLVAPSGTTVRITATDPCGVALTYQSDRR